MKMKKCTKRYKGQSYEKRRSYDRLCNARVLMSRNVSAWKTAVEAFCKRHPSDSKHSVEATQATQKEGAKEQSQTVAIGAGWYMGCGAICESKTKHEQHTSERKERMCQAKVFLSVTMTKSHALRAPRKNPRLFPLREKYKVLNHRNTTAARHTPRKRKRRTSNKPVAGSSQAAAHTQPSHLHTASDITKQKKPQQSKERKHKREQ